MPFFAHLSCRGSGAVALASRAERKSIGVVVFNGFSLPEMAQLVEAFQLANTMRGQGGDDSDNDDATPWRVTLLSPSGGRIASDSSVFVWTEGLDLHAPSSAFDTLFLIEGSGLCAELRDRRVAQWFMRAESNGERLIASARGLRWLRAARRRMPAHDDARAVRHDESANAKRASRPHNARFAVALQLIETDQGTAIARRVEKQIAHRIESPLPCTPDSIARRGPSEQIQAALRWLDTHWDESVAMHDAAEAAAMSERNFLRRFKIETGQTPNAYLQRLRVDAICRLLVQTDWPVEHIARRCGMGNGARLTRLLRSQLGVTPAAYRRMPAL
ncbi:helix-turn-helix domain-containing protein [Paraburkholderia sp. J94]|uniref:helix-turn-helix domain-containing protein n=1 Tax=Paraburkholderia sp. J94 TaxID=2805441 RepID=UPI002AAF9C69|nr:helix-turn-helix domain-containing protein [Paraburkholderia sp. J94]